VAPSGSVWVSWDVETLPFVPGNVCPPMVGAAFREDVWEDGEMRERSATRILAPAEALAHLQALIENPDTAFIGHNVVYDFGVMCGAGLSVDVVFRLYTQSRVLDTYVQERLALVRLGKLKLRRQGLVDCVARHLGADIASPMRLDKKAADSIRQRYGEWYGKPVEEWSQEAVDYLQRDVDLTMRVAESQMREGLSPDLSDQCAAAWALHLMSIWGVRTERMRVALVEAQLRETYQSYLTLPVEEGLIRSNGTKDLLKIRARVETAYAQLRKPVPRTAKGRVSTEAKVLSKSCDPALVDLAKAQKPKTLLTTFVPALKLGYDAPINTRYQVTVDSGRTSSSKPNIQNIARDGGIRECFVPRPGWTYVSADYDTLELRSLSEVIEAWFGKSRMGEALRGGRDLHLDFAARLLNIPYQEAVERRGEPKVAEARSFAKIANFGFPGGLGPNAFSEYAEAFGFTGDRAISVSQAKTLRDEWHQQWPKMALYFRRIKDLSNDLERRDGTITLDDGTVLSTFSITQPKSQRIRGGCLYTSACNTFFQGLAADGAKRALYRVSWNCYSNPQSGLYGCRPVMFIHDEIIIEVPPTADLQLAADSLVQEMVRGMASFITRVPITAEAVAMTRWSKSAMRVVDSDGRLGVWEEGASPPS